jgi:hypothetical protein
MVRLTLCLQASPQPLLQSQKSNSKTHKQQGPSHGAFTIIMSNHRLSFEQKFRLEAVFRKIDSCTDIEMLREVTKQIIASEENQKAAVREAITQMRRELEAEFNGKYRNHFNYSSIVNRAH